MFRWSETREDMSSIGRYQVAELHFRARHMTMSELTVSQQFLLLSQNIPARKGRESLLLKSTALRHFCKRRA